ncbi:MAG: TldD/PmbA family protein [Thermodesulfobacterium sp.]|nr:TldD/PmbA family protein [Thermodesulfobacterium sp.]
MKLLETLKDLSKKESVEFWIKIEEGAEIEKRDKKEFLEEKYLDESVSIRYINKDGKAGLSYATFLDPSEVKKAVSRAKVLSSCGVPSLFPEIQEKYPEVFLNTDLEIDLKKMRETLNELEEKAFSFDSAISRVEKIKLSAGKIRYILIRDNKELSFEKPFCVFLISVVAKDKDKEASSYEWYEGVDFNYREIARRVELACKKALALSKTRKGKNLKVSVLFSPFVAVELLDLLEFSFLGDEILKGRSYLKDKLGEKTFSKKITIFDDGINPYLLESRPFDDEGSAQNKKVLAEKGIVKTFLFDNYWKKEAEKKGFRDITAGNSRRPDFSSFPKISSTNFYIEKGFLEREKLLGLENEVFEVLEILGAHTANPISGDFSFGVSGIYYRKGEPVDYFCEMALSGNLFELFKNISKVGSDLSFYGSTGSPSLFVEKMDLGGGT